MFMIEPWHWLVLGLILVTLEIMVSTFALLIFGCTALLVALLSWLIPISSTVQILLWLFLSVSVALFWFKYFKPKLKQSKEEAGILSLVGQTAMITEIPTSTGKGRVRFTIPVEGIDEWDCISNDELKIGDKIVVKQVVENYLVVSKV